MEVLLQSTCRTLLEKKASSLHMSVLVVAVARLVSDYHSSCLFPRKRVFNKNMTPSDLTSWLFSAIILLLKV